MKTTLNQIKACSPCKVGWAKLLSHLGKTKADDVSLDLLTIFESNGLDDALWSLRAVQGEDAVIRRLACDFALSVQPLWKMPPIVKEYLENPTDEKRTAADAADADAYAADAAYAAYAAASHAAAAAAASHAAAAAAAYAAAAYAAAAAASYAAAAYAAAAAASHAAAAAAVIVPEGGGYDERKKQKSMFLLMCNKK